MKLSLHSARMVALLWLGSMAGCGDALVGGRCAPGFVEAQANAGGSRCVRARDGGFVDEGFDDAHDGRADSMLDATPTDATPMDATSTDVSDDGPTRDDRGDGAGGDRDETGMDDVAVRDATGDTSYLDGASIDSFAETGNDAGTGADAQDAPRTEIGGGDDGRGDDGLSDAGSGDAMDSGAGPEVGGDVAETSDARSDVVCAAGQLNCGSGCIDPASDPLNCGACGRTCSIPELCSRGVCVVTCPPPLFACGTSCVDLNTDPVNCGSCGNVCPTGVCNGGICRAARAGHLVLIGHSYELSRADQDRIVGNAVFLSPSSPARVLAYEGRADVAVGGRVASVNLAIDTTAGARPWVRTVLADSTRISIELSVDRYDVVLVYEQTMATDAQIATVATDMGSALASFARAGGVVIVIDGPTGNRGTYPVVNATGLFTVLGTTSVDNQVIDLVAPADALAVGVSTSYRARRSSVAFLTADRYTVFAEGGAISAGPVVMHRAVVP